jgi:hypothetical protein
MTRERFRQTLRTRRTSLWSALVGAVAGVALAAPVVQAQPLPVPGEPLSGCQQLVSAWVETHSTLLITVGVLALIGSFAVLSFVMNVAGGLVDRFLVARRQTSERGA